MAEFTVIPDANVEPDKPARALDGLALRDNPIAIAEGAATAPRIKRNALAHVFTFTTSGSIDVNPYDDALFAHIFCWGAGGSGAKWNLTNASAAGGGGGGFGYLVTTVAYLKTISGGVIPVTVGTGGASRPGGGSNVFGADGGSSYVDIDGFHFGGGGGKGGTAFTSSGAGDEVSGAGGFAGLINPISASELNSLSGEVGGGARVVVPDSMRGGSSVRAGAGGGSGERIGTVTFNVGGKSLYGGDGGDAGTTVLASTPGQFPGGGGGGSCYGTDSGAGANGLVIIELRETP